MAFAKVVVILVNWNGKADTLECLASLHRDLYANRQILVVDNGSADDSVFAIREQFPEVEVLETGKNLGFTGGNNIGIRWALDAGADYVFLLNNDTTVEPEALTALVKAAEAMPGYGLLAPIIHYYDRPEEAWFAGSTVDMLRGKANHDNAQVPPRDAPLKDIPWATGCAMLIRAEVIRTLQGFDERYFLYWEDVDLSFRIREQGYGLGLIPQARIYHKVSKSFAGLSRAACYYTVRNNLLFVSRHGTGRKMRALRHIVGRRLETAVRGWLGRNPKDASVLTPTLCGLCDHLLGRYGQWRATIRTHEKRLKESSS